MCVYTGCTGLHQMRLLLVAIVMALSVCVCNSSPILRYTMGTKTTYVPPDDPLFPANNEPIPEQCTLRHFEYVARHGTRNPTVHDIQNFDALQSWLSSVSYAIVAEYSWLGTWKNPFFMEGNGLLVARGVWEHYNTSRRFLDDPQYKSLTSEPYSSRRYEMQSTHVSRAGRSGTSFAYGLLQNRGPLGTSDPTGSSSGGFEPFFIYSNSPSDDVTLRFYDNCPRYLDEVKNNRTATVEAKLFQKTLIPFASDLSKKVFGSTPPPGVEIDVSTMLVMWKMCAFDAAMFEQYDHFCSFFMESNVLQAFEYADDLVKYYTASYGYRINYEMASPLLAEIVSGITAVTSGKQALPAKATQLVTEEIVEMDPPLAKYRFSHAETVIPLYTLLGLFHDKEPLKHDTPPSVYTKRAFQGSIVSPFASNIGFSLYECGSGEWKVRVQHNERDVTLPGCSAVFCDLEEEFLPFVKPLTQINFTDLCSTSTSNDGSNVAATYIAWTREQLYTSPLSFLTVLLLSLAVIRRAFSSHTTA